MKEYDSKSKSLNAQKIAYKKVELSSLNIDIKKIEAFRNEAINEIKKAAAVAIGMVAITTTVLDGAALAKGLKPVELKEEQTIAEDIKTMDLQVAYKAFCTSIITEIQNKKGFVPAADKEKLYKELANIANTTDKGNHDFLISSYGYLYGYESEEFKKIIENMHGYNFGETNPEKIKEDYEKHGGFNFMNEPINYNELFKFGIQYYQANFYSHNIKNFNLDYLKPIKNTEIDESISSVPSQRTVNSDLIEKAKEILADKETSDIKLYAFYMLHDESELNKLLDTMSYIEGKTYKTLAEYIQDRGFDDIPQWNSYVLSLQENMNNERGL